MSLSDETLCCARWRMLAKFIVFLFLYSQALVAAELGNVALNKPATQISTYEKNGQKWSASNSVDGNINCSNSPTSQYYSATTSGSSNGTWWRVDLQYVYDIKRVIVRGKPTDGNNQLTGFSLYLTDVPVDNPDLSTSVYNSSDYGNGIFNITLSKRARYCMVHRTKAYTPIVLCEVEVYGTVFDLIQMIKPKVSTSMSSIGIYNSEHTSWKSSNAIDKVIYGDPNTCGCCIGTIGNEAPWWQIDLGKVYGIGVIKIYGRTDISSPAQYQNLSIFVGNNSMENVNGTHVYTGNTNDGNYKFTLPLEPPVSFRYLMIRRFTISILTICEVEFLEQRNLVDRLKKSIITRQSSIFLNSSDYMSSNAIDRQKTYTINTCKCCSVTNSTPSPSWWQIDLRNRYLLDTVEVFSRQSGNPEQLQHANIYASNVSFNQGLTSATYVVQVPNISNMLPFIHHLQYPVTARFVIVTLANHILTLCEFNVYGTGPVCDTGRFGNSCLQRCHCSDNNSCNYLTGICQTPGCLHGWKGPACDIVTECPKGKFGNSCTQTCQTCNQMLCNDTDGLCLSGCVPGYQPNKPHCKTPCNDGQYGQNCTNSCSVTCKGGNSQCNKTDGKCGQGCIDGYIGEKCEKKCPEGKFGNNCTQTCQTCNQRLCNNTDGLCFSGCVPGYQPNKPHCKTPCNDGQYGQNCTNSCSVTCKGGNSQCNKTDGICGQGCIDGYIGEKCEKKCPEGKFGNNCTQTCQTCNQRLCNNTDGLCFSGCVPGYQPNKPHCKTPCAIGNYGQNCTSSCSGNCLNGNTQCDTTNGTCNQGCDRGYYGERCYLQCKNRTYGFNCNETCHHCKSGGICDFRSGNCTDGCSPGFNGSRCDRECPGGYFGDCTHACHCENGLTCSKTNGSCQNGCAFGWYGKNCSTDLNLIYRLTDIHTNQSSIYSSSDSYNSSKAVDGKNMYDVDHCNCCSVTDGNQPSWWQIDLGKKYLIDALRIFGRGDTYNTNQFENATVYAGNKTMIKNNAAMKFIYKIPKIINTTVFFNQLDEATIAQFFIVKHSERTLTICEFKLYEKVCSVGTFGSGCSHQCHCSDNQTCDLVTGICQTPGCLPGWRSGSCDLECEDRTFGERCNKTCHCINQTNCDNVNGTCDKHDCDPGWMDASCHTECSHGNFGKGCNHSCHCINSTACNNVNGHCDISECDPGWTGEACDNECDDGTFGPRCNHSCHCINNTACNNVNGTCSIKKCESGWIGEACDNACEDGFFGAGCKSKCHCVNSTACNNVNGHCSISKCEPGWKGDACDSECNPRLFGAECNSSCHCFNNTACNHIDGHCDIKKCDPGWTGGACDSVQESQRSSPTSSAAIGGGIGAAVALVALGIITGFIIYKRRNAKESSGERNAFSNLDRALKSRQPSASERHGSNMYAHENKSFEEDEAETDMGHPGAGDYYNFGNGFMGIRIHELWDYTKEKTENKCEILFKDFKTLPSGLVHPCTAADNLVNRGKNRYREMYAYDHSRVVLEDMDESKNTDYINACYINGYDQPKKFVASQGPTKQMIDDFWRMVWQLKSDKIVMLTNLTEMGTVKCLQYWPIEDEEEERSFGHVIVKVLKTEKFLDYNIRYFEVRKNSEPARSIRQFHFKSWPDKDVPDSTWCLVNFWRAVNTDAPSKAGPIVVHCSAGVGRTGTFIALDNLVSQAKTQGCVRPLQIVEALRMQRVNMVQTSEQYVYLHEAVADAMLFGTHIIWANQFRDIFTFMLQKGKGETKTKLEKQFELIEKSTRDAKLEADDTAEYSNVETLQSESAAYRPKLKNRGSKFVQQLAAIYIPNYKGKNTFLVSMSPDRTTMEEFWSLVDDSNIKTVIMLTEPSAPSYQASCQLGSRANSGNRFSVNKIEEKIRKGYTERTFTFKESDREDEEYLTTIKQFEYTAWKDGYAAPGDTRSLLDMIDSVQKWQPHLSESQPILIHCSDGCSRSGVACMFLNELQRMKYEGGHINILESVKMMKKRQRHLIGTYEQYRFCFDLILAHIKSTEVYENL